MGNTKSTTRVDGNSVELTGKTRILTKNGIKSVYSIVDTVEQVWSQAGWIDIKCECIGGQSGPREGNTTRVYLSDGTIVDCGSNNVWAIKDPNGPPRSNNSLRGYKTIYDRLKCKYLEVETKDLKEGDKVIPTMPISDATDAIDTSKSVIDRETLLQCYETGKLLSLKLTSKCPTADISFKSLSHKVIAGQAFTTAGLIGTSISAGTSRSSSSQSGSSTESSGSVNLKNTVKKVDSIFTTFYNYKDAEILAFIEGCLSNGTGISGPLDVIMDIYLLLKRVKGIRIDTKPQSETNSQETNSQGTNSQETNSQGTNSQETNSQETNSQETKIKEVKTKEVKTKEIIIEKILILQVTYNNYAIYIDKKTVWPAMFIEQQMLIDLFTHSIPTTYVTVLKKESLGMRKLFSISSYIHSVAFVGPTNFIFTDPTVDETPYETPYETRVSIDLPHMAPVGHMAPEGHMAPVGHMAPEGHMAPVGHMAPEGQPCTNTVTDTEPIMEPDTVLNTVLNTVSNTVSDTVLNTDYIYPYITSC